MAEEKTKPGAKKENESAGSQKLSEAISELDHFLDIPLSISVELGRANITVKDVVALQVGSVVELHKLVGEPMEIYINGLVTARGEVVVVNERFGIRVTDVIDPLEVVRSSV
ncbi:Flagellar motor switch protein FliN [hydrothermal vent metagenome]|uniref:Flagellar motor switch protein FliN n=1 Tax=hydrothermal vent metagenome TaxID=652676 RepID=A0A3B1CAI7_9ZZZZ